MERVTTSLHVSDILLNVELVSVESLSQRQGGMITFLWVNPSLPLRSVMLTNSLVVGKMVSFKAKSDLPKSTIRYGIFVQLSHQLLNRSMWQPLGCLPNIHIL